MKWWIGLALVLGACGPSQEEQACRAYVARWTSSPGNPEPSNRMPRGSNCYIPYRETACVVGSVCAAPDPSRTAVGLCTTPCSADADCGSVGFSNPAACVNGACYPTCTTNSDCVHPLVTEPEFFCYPMFGRSVCLPATCR